MRTAAIKRNNFFCTINITKCQNKPHRLQGK
jgi:hypothetical protein